MSGVSVHPPERRSSFYIMRNIVAKRLRKEAEKETVGKTAKETRKAYRAKKREYKAK